MSSVHQVESGMPARNVLLLFVLFETVKKVLSLLSLSSAKNCKKAFAFENNSTITATSISYPLGLFNNISTMVYYSWKAEDISLFINYEHQFQKFTGYIMAYYNPKSQQSIGSISYENSFSGPGIRLMLVYNH